MKAVTGDVPSPCINVCKMDDTTGWCQGCLRTLDEIAAWGALDDPAKRAVIALLPARRLKRRQAMATADPLPAQPLSRLR
jgi:predicted Fe-S protein YdhL (DUF1289 family)